jgi:hypothetical protein
MGNEHVNREPIWTESLAVGRAGFVEKIQPLILSRRETECHGRGRLRIAIASFRHGLAEELRAIEAIALDGEVQWGVAVFVARLRIRLGFEQRLD